MKKKNEEKVTLPIPRTLAEVKEYKKKLKELKRFGSKALEKKPELNF